ncbi:MAG: LuxR C-terminal-related transcriptional regulator [Actinomycetota bacterium]|nr:LuxR C-terminal-related transcriptional regulator [Actinomycetota bacterium]
MTTAWPLVGRSRELELVGDVLAGGERSAVVLAGLAGVGKTRLATECLALAATRGFATGRVTGGQAASRLAFGALAPLLPVNSGPGMARDEMLRQAMDAIVNLGNGRPLVLMVDDAHLLDGASATLVYQLVSSRSAFVVATVGLEEPAPHAIVALWKDELAERIEVPPLNTACIETLLTGALGGPVSAATLHHLAESSAGNALYLRELVLAGLESGALGDDDGIWRISGSTRLSNRLVELIEARLAGIPEPDRKVLEALAFGEPLGIDWLTTFNSAETLHQLEERGLIVTGRRGRRTEACLAHPLYGEVIRARTPALRAQLVHQGLAGRLQATGARRGEDALRLATWRLDGGGEIPPDLLVSAANTARNHWDLRLAARLAEAAVQAGGGFEAALLQAEVAVLLGDGARAEEQLALLLPLAGDDGRRVRVVGARVDNLTSSLGRTADALRVVDEALEVVTAPDARDQLAAKRAMVLHLGGHLIEALEVLRPLLARGDGQILPMVSYTAGACLARAGRFAEAMEVSRKGIEASQAAPGASPAFRASTDAIVRCSVLLGSGRLTEAAALADADYASGVAGGSVTIQAVLSLVLARVHLAIGTVATAATHAREARNLFRARQWRSLTRNALTHLAMASALAGSTADARAALAELDQLALPAEDLNAVELRRARAWTEVAAGNRAAAHNHLREAVAIARHRGDLVWEDDSLHDLARMGWPEEAVARLVELAAMVEGDLAPSRAHYATALVDEDVEGLMRISGAFEDMGAWLYAAEAAAGAAVLLRRAGQTRRAALAELRAGGLARRCEGASTPALRAVDSQALLSRREIEVAGLAAGGLTNREIAERLVVSVRTVENQLQRAYEKLGVARRADLAGALAWTAGDDPSA